MKRFHFDLGHRHFAHQTYSKYDPEAIKELLASLAWQEEPEDILDHAPEEISEEVLGLPKNLLTPDTFYYPGNYEPKYAYPLIIWLHQGRSPARSFQEQMPLISDQNYLGLEISLDQFDRTKGIGCDQVLCHIQEELVEFNLQANIHPDRIYLAGIAEGASLAMQITLSHPLQFAGFLAINPLNNLLDQPLKNFRFLRHLRGLITTTNTKAESENEKWIKPFSQLLHDAGVQVQLDTRKKSEAVACRLINQFIMDAIYASYQKE